MLIRVGCLDWKLLCRYLSVSTTMFKLGSMSSGLLAMVSPGRVDRQGLKKSNDCPHPVCDWLVLACHHLDVLLWPYLEMTSSGVKNGNKLQSHQIWAQVVLFPSADKHVHTNPKQAPKRSRFLKRMSVRKRRRNRVSWRALCPTFCNLSSAKASHISPKLCLCITHSLCSCSFIYWWGVGDGLTL